MTPASWVICEKDTGRAVIETFSPQVVESINKTKYQAVPILEYLQNLVRTAKQQNRPEMRAVI